MVEAVSSSKWFCNFYDHRATDSWRVRNINSRTVSICFGTSKTLNTNTILIHLYFTILIKTFRQLTTVYKTDNISASSVQNHTSYLKVIHFEHAFYLQHICSHVQTLLKPDFLLNLFNYYIIFSILKEKVLVRCLARWVFIISWNVPRSASVLDLQVSCTAQRRSLVDQPGALGPIRWAPCNISFRS